MAYISIDDVPKLLPQLRQTTEDEQAAIEELIIGIQDAIDYELGFKFEGFEEKTLTLFPSGLKFIDLPPYELKSIKSVTVNAADLNPTYSEGHIEPADSYSIGVVAEYGEKYPEVIPSLGVTLLELRDQEKGQGKLLIEGPLTYCDVATAFNVTANWGRGEPPPSLTQIMKEKLVTKWLNRQAGDYTGYVRAEGGGGYTSQRTRREFTPWQLSVLRNIKTKFKQKATGGWPSIPM